MRKSVAPTGVRLPPEVREEAKKMCVELDRSMNWYIVKAVRDLNQRMREANESSC